MAPDAPVSRAVLMTAPAPAAIATIRLSGPAVSGFCAAHLDRPLRSNRCVHCNLRSGGEVVDDVLAVLVDADTVDLSVHGGVWVVQSVLDLLALAGFERTDWREAPPRMVTDSDDPIEQQMLIDLPRALTDETLAILLAQPEAWAEMLARPDPAILERARNDRSLERLLDPPTVAIVGAPNVGKSTLANQLFARDHSIIADQPGTTRDWVGEKANLDGLVVTLIDTPGQRETTDAIEAAAIDRARPVVARADLVIVVLDASRPIEPMEKGLLHTHRDAIIVVNKSDLGGSPVAGGLAICARAGEGVDALRERIRACFGCGDLTSLHARCWTDGQRQRLTGAGGRE